VYENRVLRRLLGPKRVEVVGDWRRLHNEELHNPHLSSHTTRATKLRRMRWAGHAGRMRQARNAHTIPVGKPEEKRPLGRPRRRWEDNIRMDTGKQVGNIWTGFIRFRTGTLGILST
jgi:hypothetical protein